MRISLLTDAPKHNLALMRIASWHKLNGDSVQLNLPIFPADYRYASVLFEKNKHNWNADEFGGPAFNGVKLPDKINIMMPDYTLFDLDYSLGYTWRYCPRNCGFCKVPEQKNPME